MDDDGTEKAERRQEATKQMLATIQYRVRGELRFLSHAEMMRLFQRACARAGVKILYSQGFNPHPKMSLVLPRSVGVESDDELLCLWIRQAHHEWLEEGKVSFDVELLKKEMPQGIEIISANISEAKKIPEPASARYVIKVKKELAEGQIKETIDGLSKKEKILVDRRVDEGPKTKVVDVRPFMKSISEEGKDIFVDCAITQSGTIRVEEILGLLQLCVEDLAEPVLRKSVQYTN